MSSSSTTRGFADASKRAQSTLDYIISGEEEKQLTRNLEQIPISEALGAGRKIRFDSKRDKSRVLFISSDRSCREPNSRLIKHVLNLESVFSELHLVVVSPGSKRDYPARRLGHNTWVYTVEFASQLYLNDVVRDFAEAQLIFSNNFRPDVIVSLDPLWAGQAGQTLAKQFDRPHQIHVTHNYFSGSFAETGENEKQMASLARSVLKKAKSVRTDSTLVKGYLENNFSNIEDLAMLPRHFDTEETITAKRSTILREKYPQYSFIILTVGTLDADNNIFKVLDAARSMLHAPRIGLIVLGDGPQKAELLKRCEILGIKEQVIFEPNLGKLQDYLLSADMFVCIDNSDIGDEYVIQAAAAGLPIVMTKTNLRSEIFSNGVSGLIVEDDDELILSQKMNELLNTNAYRLQFGTNAKLVVKDRLHTDPQLYRTAYRDSIEAVFGTEKVEKNKAKSDSTKVG